LNKLVKDEKWLLIFIVSAGRNYLWDISSQIRQGKEFWSSSGMMST
jgi:hypothetical protein